MVSQKRKKCPENNRTVRRTQTDCIAMGQAWDKRNSQSIILVTEDSLLNK